MSCQVSTDQGVLDLSPLIKQDEYYIAMAETPSGENGDLADTAFYLSVCGPLKDSQTCPKGTGICMVTDSETKVKAYVDILF